LEIKEIDQTSVYNCVLGNVKNVDRTNCIAEMNLSIGILIFSVIYLVKIFLYDINVSYNI